MDDIRIVQNMRATIDDSQICHRWLVQSDIICAFIT